MFSNTAVIQRNNWYMQVLDDADYADGTTGNVQWVSAFDQSGLCIPFFVIFFKSRHSKLFLSKFFTPCTELGAPLYLQKVHWDIRITTDQTVVSEMDGNCTQLLHRPPPLPSTIRKLVFLPMNPHNIVWWHVSSRSPGCRSDRSFSSWGTSLGTFWTWLRWMDCRCGILLCS